MVLLPGDLVVRPHIALLVLEPTEFWEHINTEAAHERLFGAEIQYVALGDERPKFNTSFMMCWASEHVQIVRDGEILFQLPLSD